MNWMIRVAWTNLFVRVRDAGMLNYHKLWQAGLWM
jgi:hypothetical protein